MKFIEVREGFSIKVDSIVAVGMVGDNQIEIETESRVYKINGSFRLFMDFIEAEDNRDRERVKMTAQFFGG